MSVKGGTGRRLRLQGGIMVALVVKMWYTRLATTAMDAMGVFKFWRCWKQSQKGCRWGWSFKDRSDEAAGTHRHCRCCRMDAQLLANGRHAIHAFCCKAQTLNLGDASASLEATFVPPVACIEGWSWRPLCLHSVTMAALEQPRQWSYLLYASFMLLVVPPHPVFEQRDLSRELQRSHEQS